MNAMQMFHLILYYYWYRQMTYIISCYIKIPITCLTVTAVMGNVKTDVACTISTI